MATQDRSQTSGGQLDQVKQAAAEKTGEARHKVSEKASGKLREQADTRSTQVGEQVRSVAEAVRESSSTLREKGMDGPAKALDTVSDKIEDISEYLTDGDADRFLDDFDRFGRGKPWAVLGATAAVGFLASRLVKTSTSNRVQSSQGDRSLGTGSTGAIPAKTGTGYPSTGASSMPTTSPGAQLSGAGSRGNGYSIDSPDRR